MRVTIPLLCLLLSSCTTEEIFEKPDKPERLVRVLFAPEKIGDSSFNDDILLGIMQEQQNNDIQVYCHIMDDFSECDSIVSCWLEDSDDGNTKFNIFAGSEFEEYVRKYDNGAYYQNSLIFDTPSQDLPMPAFHFCGYGASYLAGVAAYEITRSDSAVCMGAYQEEPFVNECFDGFTDGFIEAGGEFVERVFISDGTEGYSMPAKAYMMTDSLSRKYPFIYGMAGGSNMGIYQFLREHSDIEMYTLGVIVDQQNYSERIIGSVITEIGRCTANCIRQWTKNERIERFQIFDLSTGYIHFSIADRYKECLQNTLEHFTAYAVSKEKEYEERIYNNVSVTDGADSKCLFKTRVCQP